MLSMFPHGLVVCYSDANFATSFDHANVAQLVEQLIRNEQVTGSSPVIGSATPSVHATVGVVHFVEI